jgi:hypothetical protein
MNVLVESSGRLAALAQKASHLPSWNRYCSTFDR